MLRKAVNLYLKVSKEDEETIVSVRQFKSGIVLGKNNFLVLQDYRGINRDILSRYLHMYIANVDFVLVVVVKMHYHNIIGNAWDRVTNARADTLLNSSS